ncbi:MAG: S41 family peptidase [Acidobacteria bacterium]|nr:S41 family peptidase [Acidobacteriota bacterium]
MAHSQNINLEAINGRWSLTIEDRLRRSEVLADLRVQAGGTARLVVLGPTAGEDGLFTGRIRGNQVLLNGQYASAVVELDLSVQSDRVTGQMAGANWRADLQGQRAQVKASEVPVRDYGMLFEAIWNGVRQHFIDPRLNGIDLVAVRRRYLPRVKAARNEGDLVVAIRQSLRELRVSNTEFFLSTGNATTRLKTDRVVWKQLAPDAGYLALSDFTAEDLQKFDAQLDRALDEVGGYPALVIDLRGNRGENLQAALAALNFLLPEGRSVAYFVTREGLQRLGVSSIDQINPSSLPASFVDNQVGVSNFKGAGMYLAGGKYKRPYRGRIALLIDESCTGSCEMFAAAMKEAAIATLIGRRTRGSTFFSSPVTFTLLNWSGVVRNNVKGWRMELPIMDIRMANGMKIEGKGVEPDVLVERTATGDAELDHALSWLEKGKRNKRK